MKYITDTTIPIKSWCNEPEDGALVQARNLANLPFSFKHVALMPDTHQGYGMPIGGVLATKGVIIPNAVGVDIGCGMCALKTSLTELSTEDLKAIMGHIRNLVPVGFNHHQSPYPQYVPSVNTRDVSPTNVVLDQLQKAQYQVGTLGGGNHFIEIQKGSDGYIWVMIHSGSRNLGKTVADYYNTSAKILNATWHSSVPKEWELAFLPLDSQEGTDYSADMQYCVDFALANRRFMLENIYAAFCTVIPSLPVMPEFINVAHNYAQLEHHYGVNVMVHRKGATSAKLGEIGIIPGSQGTKSYIVSGKGNQESFTSCSHGSGRMMGRKEAQRSLSLEDEQGRLDKLGVIHSVRTVKDLDEAPGSYKDIAVVMSEQTDLVEICVELTPLGVIKG